MGGSGFPFYIIALILHLKSGHLGVFMVRSVYKPDLLASPAPFTVCVHFPSGGNGQEEAFSNFWRAKEHALGVCSNLDSMRCYGFKVSLSCFRETKFLWEIVEKKSNK